MDSESGSIHFAETSLLLFTKKGLLRRMHCPIVARCIQPVGKYALGDRVLITKIHQSEAEQLAYEIDGLVYPFHHFELLIH